MHILDSTKKCSEVNKILRKFLIKKIIMTEKHKVLKMKNSIKN